MGLQVSVHPLGLHVLVHPLGLHVSVHPLGLHVSVHPLGTHMSVYPLVRLLLFQNACPASACSPLVPPPAASFLPSSRTTFPTSSYLSWGRAGVRVKSNGRGVAPAYLLCKPCRPPLLYPLPLNNTPLTPYVCLWNVQRSLRKALQDAYFYISWIPGCISPFDPGSEAYFHCFMRDGKADEFSSLSIHNMGEQQCCAFLSSLWVRRQDICKVEEKIKKL